jgi:hypothetical protein
MEIAFLILEDIPTEYNQKQSTDINVIKLFKNSLMQLTLNVFHTYKIRYGATTSGQKGSNDDLLALCNVMVLSLKCLNTWLNVTHITNFATNMDVNSVTWMTVQDMTVTSGVDNNEHSNVLLCLIHAFPILLTSLQSVNICDINKVICQSLTQILDVFTTYLRDSNEITQCVNSYKYDIFNSICIFFQMYYSNCSNVKYELILRAIIYHDIQINEIYNYITLFPHYFAHHVSNENTRSFYYSITTLLLEFIEKQTVIIT